MILIVPYVRDYERNYDMLTTISISKITRQRLAIQGDSSETCDVVLNRIINFYEKYGNGKSTKTRTTTKTTSKHKKGGSQCT